MSLIFATLNTAMAYENYEIFGNYDDAEIIKYTGNLSVVRIPSVIQSFTIRGISNGAFQGNEYINRVIVPSSVTHIGTRVFSGCSNLSSISLGGNIKHIGEYAFAGCTSLRSISLGNNLESIDSYAFLNCTSLTSITIPSTVTRIDANAFYGCKNLTSITISDSANGIHAQAFDNTGYYNNTANWSDNVLYIGNHVIQAKTSISYDCTIKSGTRAIAKKAFYNCSKMKNIILPDSITYMGTDAFYGCSGLDNLYISDVAAWCNINFVNKFSNPSYYAQNLLLNGSIVKELVIPDTVTSIKEYAFIQSSGLTSVVVPDSVTSIGRGAFRGCNKLESISLPFVGASKKTTGKYTDVFGYIFDYDSSSSSGTVQYYNDSYYTTYLIPSSLKKVTITNATQIPYGAFYNCSNLTDIEINDGVTQIGKSAFYNCSALVNINIPESVTTVGYNAFYKCSNLENVDIDDIVSWCKISFNNNYSNPLWYAENLYINNVLSNGEITIPEEATKISAYAFNGWSALTDVKIADSVKNIGNNAFSTCINLKSIEIPDNVTAIGQNVIYNTAFYNDSSNWNGELLYVGNHLIDAKPSASGEYNIKPETKTIANAAFYDCSGITVVNYNGNKSAWNKIKVGADNATLTNALKNYFYFVDLINENGELYCSKMNNADEVIQITEIPLEQEEYILKLYTDKDYTEEFDINSVVDKNLTLYYRYEYKNFLITVFGQENPITVTYNSNFIIEPRETEEYRLVGYFTEENGKGVQITDTYGKSLEKYSFLENITIYPYYIIANKIYITGENQVLAGQQGVKQDVVFETNKDIMYLGCGLKFPEYFELKKIESKDFIEVYEDSRTTIDGYTHIFLTGIYDYEGNYVPKKQEITPFILEFDVLKDAEPGIAAIEIENAVYVGEDQYEVKELIPGQISVVRVLAESIEITGEEEIKDKTQFSVKVLPEETYNKEVAWSVDDETVASISQDGTVTPLKNGTVNITATAKDRSGVFATKKVQVTAYAKINSLKSGSGVWSRKFNPDTREYTVYVKEDATQITLTPTFTGGILSLNGTGIWVNGMSKTILLTDSETMVTLNRVNVTDLTDSEYKITIIKGDVKTTLSDDGKAFTVTPVNADMGNIVALALYNDGVFSGMQMEEFDGEKITFNTNNDYTNAKVMIFESLETLTPLCEAEEISAPQKISLLQLN